MIFAGFSNIILNKKPPLKLAGAFYDRLILF